MSWDYRVMKSDHGFQIYEVYYNLDGTVELHSTSAVAPFGETVEELRSDLLYMAAAISKPPLTEKDIKFGTPDLEEEE